MAPMNEGKNGRTDGQQTYEEGKKVGIYNFISKKSKIDY